MLRHTFTGSFKKDIRLMEKRRKDTGKLREVMGLIINEQPLPPERRDHPLIGEHKGNRECHLEGDWVLIYKVRPEAETVTFRRTGTHSDLFKK